MDAGKAKVIDVVKTKRYRQRPHPLNTIEAQKLISRKLRISSA
jgi:DNA topoisomerase IA